MQLYYYANFEAKFVLDEVVINVKKIKSAMKCEKSNE